jgi:hypothetical protein
MRRFLVLALALALAGLVSDAALAKSKSKFWSRWDATVVCDVAKTTVLVNNPTKQDVAVIVRLTDSAGDTQQVLTVPAESIKSFDCTSLGVAGKAVLSFEGPVSLYATAIYESPAGTVVDVDQIDPVGASGRAYPSDDSDTGDSDSASGDPTPMP